MTLELVLGVIRAIGAAIGGYFISSGAATAATTEQVIGGIILLATAAWSVIAKLYPTTEFKQAVVEKVEEDKKA